MFNNALRVVGVAVAGGLGLYACYSLSGDREGETVTRLSEAQPEARPMDDVSNDLPSRQTANAREARPTATGEELRQQRLAMLAEEGGDVPAGPASDTQESAAGDVRPVSSTGTMPPVDSVRASSSPSVPQPTRLASASGVDTTTITPRTPASAASPSRMTRNPVTGDKVRNARLVDKKDDGPFFTENTRRAAFDPCTKADGTPYEGPGTALNPFAPTSPCLPKKTDDNPDGSFILASNEKVTASDGFDTPEEYLPPEDDFFGPNPPLPPGVGNNSDYSTG